MQIAQYGVFSRSPMGKAKAALQMRPYKILLRHVKVEAPQTIADVGAADGFFMRTI